jgi:hypothetical protein
LLMNSAGLHSCERDHIARGLGLCRHRLLGRATADEVQDLSCSGRLRPAGELADDSHHWGVGQATVTRHAIPGRDDRGAQPGTVAELLHHARLSDAGVPREQHGQRASAENRFEGRVEAVQFLDATDEAGESRELHAGIDTGAPLLSGLLMLQHGLRPRQFNGGT